jgi:hypothetical protein
MKNPWRLALLVIVFTGASTHAQTWSTGFFNRSNAYTGVSLDGTPTNAPAAEQWQTTDPYDPVTTYGSTSQLQNLLGWTLGPVNPASTRNQSVLFGGYGAAVDVLPGITNPVLYRDFVNTFGTATTTFSTDFAIVGPSSGSFPSNDTFGFSLNDAGGSSLAAFQFVPNGPAPTALTVQWVQNGTNAVTNGTTFSGFSIQYNSLYRLEAVVSSNQLTMTLAGISTQTNGTGVVTNYVAGSPSTIVNGGTLSGGLFSSDFEQAAITWDLASGDNLNPGGNYMIVNQVSVVPEPSTVGLLALGLAAVGSFYLRRRRNS